MRTKPVDLEFTDIKTDTMITETTIQKAISLLVQSGHPSKIFLFGSYARGEANDRSDLDFLIVQKEVGNRRLASVHYHDASRLLRIPVDIIVASEATFQEWEEVAGTIFYEGRICYDAA